MDVPMASGLAAFTNAIALNAHYGMGFGPTSTPEIIAMGPEWTLGHKQKTLYLPHYSLCVALANENPSSMRKECPASVAILEEPSGCMCLQVCQEEEQRQL